MASLKNTTINDTGFLQLPAGTNAQRPTAEPGMMRYNSDLATIEYYRDSIWQPLLLPFQQRQIITTTYLAGGYKDAVPWNNVNRTFNATDSTVNLGDNSMERSFNYQCGACSSTSLFVFGAGNGHVVSSNYIVAFNMVTESQLTSGFSRTLANSRVYAGAVFEETRRAYTAGGVPGSAQVEQMDFATQTISSLSGVNYAADYTWAMSHESFGLFFGTETAQTFSFATRTTSARGGTAPSAHHQQKSVQSKLNNCYAGNEGTYEEGFNLRRTNMYTNTTSGTVPKPVGDSGEENFSLGQDHQYMIGMYNGAQNTISWKFYYATESGFRGTSQLEPKGKVGASSGVMGWKA
jgi:hypothetical protein